MLLNTTYKDSKNDDIIEKIVGKQFSLMQKFRLKGVGSKRMILENVSPNLKPILNNVSDINYASIELRPKGILVRITQGHNKYTWIIPYYHLVLYNVNGKSIHAQGSFILFKQNKTLKENKAFFNKLISKKIEYQSIFELPY